MKATIYANYGLLAHEKEVVYTYPRPATDVYDELRVELPSIDGADWFLSVCDEPCIKLGNYVYSLSELLLSIDDCPVLSWIDDCGGVRCYEC